MAIWQIHWQHQHQDVTELIVERDINSIKEMEQFVADTKEDLSKEEKEKRHNEKQTLMICNPTSKFFVHNIPKPAA